MPIRPEHTTTTQQCRLHVNQSRRFRPLVVDDGIERKITIEKYPFACIDASSVVWLRFLPFPGRPLGTLRAPVALPYCRSYAPTFVTRSCLFQPLLLDTDYLDICAYMQPNYVWLQRSVFEICMVFRTIYRPFAQTAFRLLPTLLRAPSRTTFGNVSPQWRCHAFVDNSSRGCFL